jgi:hypothetical protein
MIVSIKPSKQKNKRFEITMDNNKKYNFGLKNGKTFIDHHDEKKRKNYRLRHYANKTEFKLISNLVPSPSLFSAIILWGPYTKIIDNINYLNKLWKEE